MHVRNATNAKESRLPRRLVNSCAKKFTMFAKENTAPNQPNKPSRSVFRRLAELGYGCQLRAGAERRSGRGKRLLERHAPAPSAPKSVRRARAPVERCAACADMVVARLQNRRFRVTPKASRVSVVAPISGARRARRCVRKARRNGGPQRAKQHGRARVRVRRSRRALAAQRHDTLRVSCVVWDAVKARRKS